MRRLSLGVCLLRQLTYRHSSAIRKGLDDVWQRVLIVVSRQLRRRTSTAGKSGVKLSWLWPTTLLL